MSLINFVDVSDLEKVELADDFFRIFLYYSSKVQWFVKGFYYFFLLQKRSFFETKWDILFDLIEVSKLTTIDKIHQMRFSEYLSETSSKYKFDIGNR